ncbi:hypothetical protein BV22DRAFT_1115648 [Leucogyrophana mollusca]|uniref:Uncharacterized protein n=1 Tax=Leucogyrophana mollusca TaxID=85980 RepID=A0ACB8C1Q7_9AGAM|nr:hypothetical protein BV22DRAFT_1115648 [Leucogyrophana mollusca]
MLESLDLTQQELPITSYFSRGKKENRPVVYSSKKKRKRNISGEGGDDARPTPTKRGKGSVSKDAQPPVENVSEVVGGLAVARSGALRTGLGTPSGEPSRKQRRSPRDPAPQTFFGRKGGRTSATSEGSQSASKLHDAAVDDILDLTKSDDDEGLSISREKETPARGASKSQTGKPIPGRLASTTQSLATPPPTNQPKKRASIASRLNDTPSIAPFTARRSPRPARVCLPTPETTVRKPPFTHKLSLLGASGSSPDEASPPSEFDALIPPLSLNPTSINDGLSAMEFSGTNSGSVADDERSPSQVAGVGPRADESEENPFISLAAEVREAHVTDPSGLSPATVTLGTAEEARRHPSSASPSTEEHHDFSQPPFVLSSQSQYLLGLDATPRRKRTSIFPSPTRGDLMSPSRRSGAVPSSQTQEEREMFMSMPPPLIPAGLIGRPENGEPAYVYSPKSPFKRHMELPCLKSVTPRRTTQSKYQRSRQFTLGSSSITSPSRSPANTTPTCSRIIAALQRRRMSTLDSPSRRSAKKSPTRRTSLEEPSGIEDDDSATEPESDSEMVRFVAELSRKRAQQQNDSLTEAESDTEIVQFVARLSRGQAQLQSPPTSTAAQKSPRARRSSGSGLLRSIASEPSFCYDGTATLMRDGAGPSISGRYTRRGVNRDPFDFADSSLPSVVRDFMDMFEGSDSSYPPDFPESLRC